MRKYLALAVLLAGVSTPSLAQIAVTNLDSPLPAGTSFGVIPGENSADAITEITSSTALSSNGSLRISGNRTRVQSGVQYGAPTNLGVNATELLSLTGDYLVTNGGNGGIQSPAFRAYVNNTTAGLRGELIWEAAYNGGYTLGAAATVDADDLFWMFQAGCGFVGTTGCNGGSYQLKTLATWGDELGSDWFVSAIGIGSGGGAGVAFDALADNLTLATTSTAFGTKTYDFQTAAAVPEPATWGMMLMGFGALGLRMRKRSNSATRAVTA